MLVAMRVLIVEDEIKMASLIRRGLRGEGLAADVAIKGEDALWMAASTTYDVIVLDVMLPGIDGFEVCRRLREQEVWTPVLILTARDAIPDRVKGLDSGADDYLVKPFAFKELVVRLHALIRRGQYDAEPIGEGLAMNPAAHAVSVEGQTRTLTPTEYRLLAKLAARRGEVVRRRELTLAAWPDGAIVHDNTLDAYVARIRRKLRELGREDAIVTVHGVGYRLG